MYIAKVCRIVTVAPFMAGTMLVVLFINNPVVFGNSAFFAAALVFLTVLPLLAYPLQPLFSHYRSKGREGQRTLAMLFAAAGYVLGCALAFIAHAPNSLKIIFLSYLFSAILIILFNKLIHVRASGHACGVAGPFAILVFFGQLAGFLGIIPLVIVWWSSLKAKRHTPGQLIVGTALPFLALAAAMTLIYAM
ncbi:MAG TPA: hypothetical protein VHO66_00100 [Ruminiclostridium sp.]|nr:hypothetical protein [Ruminiclostridium sp.]